MIRLATSSFDAARRSYTFEAKEEMTQATTYSHYISMSSSEPPSGFAGWNSRSYVPTLLHGTCDPVPAWKWAASNTRGSRKRMVRECGAWTCALKME